MLSVWQQQDVDHVWHPFTPMTVYARESPPMIVSGKGFYLEDAHGKQYLDGISALWCNVHGYQVPELDAAITEQLGKIAHTTFLGGTSPIAIELAFELAQRTPGDLNHVFYSDAGATAVEAALKIAVQYHAQKQSGAEKRTKFIRMDGAYHGDTIGSVSIGKIDAFHKPFEDLLFETMTVPSPVAYRAPQGYDEQSWLQYCYDAVEQILSQRADEVAAFVIEPLVQGAAGILVHSSGYLKFVREITQKYGIPLIADEVAVGFGKTGTLFACEQEEVVPDIMCLAKGITGGYLPLAATVVNEEIYSAFLGEPSQGRTFYHGHTYTGNALASAVSLASLKLIDDNKVLENVAVISSRLQQRLEEVAKHPHVGDVRQQGVMIGIELMADKSNQTAYDSALRMGNQIAVAARKRGVIVRPLGDVIVLMPAIAMPVQQIDELCDAVFESIQEVCV
ncbi:MAG: adenosylmethionine--8-amino-7-oxononanoate transaminase [Planctomycetaceae bacterium]|nr:adenosylmethionine--8-amino-7-oxononanoate transaminase [Planctomycetaceae bacterium]